MFQSVTQRCASTGWFRANIGTKYLQVMRYVINLPNDLATEKEKNLEKYEIFASVVHHILLKLKNKIKQVNENVTLSIDDKVLISHLSIISFEMCH